MPFKFSHGLSLMGMMTIFLVFISVKPEAQPTKRALVITIGDYPDPLKNGWRKISSGNDRPMIVEALKAQGFRNENMQLVSDAQATRQGIIKALEQLGESSAAGDHLVVHISSHGQQIQDDNADEMDGLDEAIVPYGAVYSSDVTKFEQLSKGYLRDDEFGKQVTRLRNKLGSSGDLLIILDACHSGTATRGGNEPNLLRGGNPAMTAKPIQSGSNTKDTKGVFNDDLSSTLSESSSPVVIISGAQAAEINYECFDDNNIPVGSLTYAFCKSLAKPSVSGGELSYRGLFAAIQNNMSVKAPRQHPVIEGSGMDKGIFGGDYIIQKPYFTAASWNNPTECIINAGKLAGLYPGSVLSFYPSNTHNPDAVRALARGWVEKSGNFSSVIKVDSPSIDLTTSAPWIFLSEMAFGGDRLKIGLGKALRGSSVEKYLGGVQNVLVSDTAELYLDTAGTDQIALRFSNSLETFTEPIHLTDQLWQKKLNDNIRRYDRYKYLNSLSFNEQGLAATVELLFLDKQGRPDLAKSAERSRLGRLELMEGDLVYLKIRNTGSKHFYVNIVDLQPDGFINPILPNKSLKDPTTNTPYPITAQDCHVKRGDSLFLTQLPIEIMKPFGGEVFKVFLSTAPLDLEDILTGTGHENSRGPGGVLNKLAKVFEDAEPGPDNTRGANPRVNTDQNGTVFSVNFQIVPKR